MVRKIIDVINKDVAHENETKSLMIVLRIVLLCSSFYMLTIAVLSSVYRLWQISLISLFFLITFAVTLHLTYKCRTRPILYSFMAMKLLWVLLSVFLIGWAAGTPLIMLLLLVMVFFDVKIRSKTKTVFAMSLCVFSVVMYVVSQDRMLEVRGYVEILHAMTLAVVFLGMTVVCWFFSEKVMENEKKLMIYNQRLQHDAATDPLTGLPNRRKMFDELNDSVHKVKTLQMNTFSIAIGDIDFFKRVNDTLGHECGDLVLQELSKLFSEFIKGKGKAARWGGEEFLFLFDNMNGDEASIEMDKLMASIRKKTIHYKDEQLKTTLTFGLEEYDGRSDLTENIKRADEKLYLGKNSGRNRVVY